MEQQTQQASETPVVDADSWLEFVLPRLQGGAYEDHEQESEVQPNRLFPCASLHPLVKPDREGQSITEEEDIRSMGLRFRTGAPLDAITVTARVAVFTPHLARRVFDKARETAQEGGAENFRVDPVWKRHEVNIGPLQATIPTGTDWEACASIREAFEVEFAAIQQMWEGQEDRFCPNMDGRLQIEVPTATEWDDLAPSGPSAFSPRWRCDVLTRQVADDGANLVEILLENRLEVQFKDRFKVGDVALYDVAMEVRAPATLLPMDAKGFANWDDRVEVSYFSAGTNCAVDERRADEGILAIAPTPIETTIRPRHRTQLPDGTPFPSIGELANRETCIPALERVLQGMRAYATTAKTTHPNWDHQAFAAECNAFEAGLQALKVDATTREAFLLCQQSFEDSWKSQGIPGWRAFQLVGLVGECAYLADPKLPRRPLVIQMSTGGGKTELYLGIILLWAFHGRLLGEERGTVAWASFPLRLLSLQQAERFLKVLSSATDIMAESSSVPEECKKEPFSVGYYAGGGNSANDLWFPGAKSPDLGNVTTQLTPDAEAARDELSYTAGEAAVGATLPRGKRFLRDNQKVVHCPRCLRDGITSSITTSWDADRVGLKHACTRAECGYVLPLYVSDVEVLRRQPTILVGTLDKMARIGTHLDDLMLYGLASGECPKHGLSLTSGSRCNVVGCSLKTTPLAKPMPAPRVIIQDELHLVNEGFGAIAAPYERMRRRLIRARNGAGPRIITSTATITGFERHIEELYGEKDPVRFPAPGPGPDESFHVEPSGKRHRRFVGLLPTHAATGPTVQRLAEVHLRWVESRQGAPWDELRAMTPMLVYCLSKANLQKHKRIVLSEVSNQALPRFGIEGVTTEQIAELSGDSRAEDVGKTLTWLETMAPDERCRAIFATSMVSHGVDLEVLNVMAVDGVPNTVPEEIQATSRVGRGSLEGIVAKVYNRRNARELTAFPYHMLHHRHLTTRVPPTNIDGTSKAAWEKAARAAILMETHLRCIQARRRPSNRTDFAAALGDYEAEVKASVKDLLDESGIKLNLDQIVDEVRSECLSSAYPGNFHAFQAAHCFTSLRDLPDAVHIYCNGEM